MTRILTIAAVLAMLCPTASNATDVSVSSKTRLAVLTFGTQSEKRMTPRPAIRSACYDKYVRCDSASTCHDQCCAPHTFNCDGNGYCECS
jgi:hypothetical protein